jgi:hypothetical protein
LKRVYEGHANFNPLTIEKRKKAQSAEQKEEREKREKEKRFWINLVLT